MGRQGGPRWWPPTCSAHHYLYSRQARCPTSPLQIHSAGSRCRLSTRRPLVVAARSRDRTQTDTSCRRRGLRSTRSRAGVHAAVWAATGTISLKHKQLVLSLCNTTDTISLKHTQLVLSLCNTTDTISLTHTQLVLSLCNTTDTISLTHTQ